MSTNPPNPPGTPGTPKPKKPTAKSIAKKVLEKNPQMPEIERLKKDVLLATAMALSTEEVRWLVDTYYQIQDYRMTAGNEVLSLAKSGEPHALIAWTFSQFERIELEIQKTLAIYTDNEPTGMGVWAKGICGIDKVISAGLLAHIDLTKCVCPQYKHLKRDEKPPHTCPGIQTVGDIWAFAGYDPTRKWGKGEKRPFNAKFKVLCWKIGQSFMKVQSNKNDYYGKLYKQRKLIEIAKNERLEFADQAKAKLENFKIGKDKKARAIYESGMLPDGHIDARARRWVVKLFLAHWFEEAYRRQWKKESPNPYPIAYLGHAHVIPAPGSDFLLKENEDDNATEEN